MTILKNDWALYLEQEFKQPYYQNLREFLIHEYTSQMIYPDKYDIFNALHYTSFADTKVVILGQDPYHGPGQAHGLSFSVKPGIQPPPSLQNMFKELHEDLGCSIPRHGYLVDWAKQGVLLLNAVLTVRQSTPNSHQNKGWETFTDKVIEALNQKEEPVVFLLWGSRAQQKSKLITNKIHHILKAPHPSPLSSYRGFFGSHPFSQANQILRDAGVSEINWQLPMEVSI